MPIIIRTEDFRERLATLCKDEMTLPAQIPALEEWLRQNKEKIRPGSYVADVGFSAREDATGGGPVLSPEMLRTMADLGMWLYLSEYNSGEEKKPNQTSEPTAPSGRGSP